jgi:hypothetical protein
MVEPSLPGAAGEVPTHPKFRGPWTEVPARRQAGGEAFTGDRDGTAMPGTKRRDRYIVLDFSDPRHGRTVAAAFRAAVAAWPAGERPHLVFVEGGRALVRCGHRQKDEVVRFLNGLRVGNPPIAVRTVGTSGTIRRARLRYFSKA